MENSFLRRSALANNKLAAFKADTSRRSTTEANTIDSVRDTLLRTDSFKGVAYGTVRNAYSVIARRYETALLSPRVFSSQRSPINPSGAPRSATAQRSSRSHRPFFVIPRRLLPDLVTPAQGFLGLP